MISVLDSLEHDAALMQLCSLLYVSVFPPILGYVILVYGILYSFSSFYSCSSPFTVFSLPQLVFAGKVELMIATVLCERD